MKKAQDSQRDIFFSINIDSTWPKGVYNFNIHRWNGWFKIWLLQHSWFNYSTYLIQFCPHLKKQTNRILTIHYTQYYVTLNPGITVNVYGNETVKQVIIYLLVREKN